MIEPIGRNNLTPNQLMVRGWLEELTLDLGVHARYEAAAGIASRRTHMAFRGLWLPFTKVAKLLGLTPRITKYRYDYNVPLFAPKQYYGCHWFEGEWYAMAELAKVFKLTKQQFSYHMRTKSGVPSLGYKKLPNTYYAHYQQLAKDIYLHPEDVKGMDPAHFTHHIFQCNLSTVLGA